MIAPKNSLNVWPGLGRFSLVLGAGVLIACATPLPPKDLVQARASYDRASKGPAAQLAPAELDTAKQALMRAESAFQEEGDDDSTRDLAYIAERKALVAESRAGVLQAEQDKASAEKDFKKAQLSSLDTAKAQLEAEREAREKTEQSVVQARGEIAKTQAQLEAEKRAREDAEKRAAAALASLHEIAKVKEESRGVVITLSGQVLFATGKYELLPIARDKLNEVAKALKDQGFKSLLVEGHTDSRGNAAKNEELSFKRAESVRMHLVSQGIAPDKIRATGLGSNRPVADNATPEGRANNRRVEIVVEPER
jgi:outer membrane protein OmpA-like peptidoglycan-associated protein